MFRYKLEIEYLGDKYCGMQIQNDLDSIQSVVEESLSFFIKQVISIKFSGRTDAKVNAYNQVCHFDTEVDLNKCKLIKSLNFFLREKNIVVVDLQLVDDKFHSRFTAKKRSYRYKIILRNSPTVIERNLLWHIYHKINLIEFIDNAKYFIGHHDFNAFRSIQCQAKNSHRTIDTIEVRIFHFITKEKIFDIKYEIMNFEHI
jgi:tRNA pseudouridine38-40 synthase